MKQRIILIFSGADGSGKSTIIDFCRQELESRYIWSRYDHYIQRLINLLSRIFKKSYREKLGEEVYSYHLYSGIWGYVYLVASLVDNYFAFFLRTFWIKFVDRRANYIIDRANLDKVVDLILDGIPSKAVIFFYHPLLSLEKRLMGDCRVCVLTKKENILMRRPDSKFDRKLDEKVRLYEDLGVRYCSIIRNDGDINESIEQVLDFLNGN